MGKPIETTVKNGVAWSVGGQAEVDWITARTEDGRRVNAAIPPLFAATGR
jgi:Flp pilus assembly CpaF family ATPase